MKVGDRVYSSFYKKYGTIVTLFSESADVAMDGYEYKLAALGHACFLRTLRKLTKLERALR